MTTAELIIFIIEIVGTLAFASSGAMVAINKNMDIFGINVLGIVTAVGGGVIRDIILGINPPLTFTNPVYVLLAICTSTLLFFIYYLRNIRNREITKVILLRYERIMLAFDAVGLAAFTSIGINTALTRVEEPSGFLLLFVGVITGIGGGIIRDMMAGVTPFVLVKHVYALASIVGAGVCIILKNFMDVTVALIAGAAVITVIRLLAMHYKWNLPKPGVSH